MNDQNLTQLNTRQQGIALFMALVFLLIMTILGITSMGTSNLQEKMAQNTKDRGLAFQAAETAMLAAENWINAQVGKPTFPNNANGLYLANTCPDPTKQVWDCYGLLDWETDTNVVVYPGTPGASAGAGSPFAPPAGGILWVRTQPKYIIEFVTEIEEKGDSKREDNDGGGSKKTILRVTARGTGGTDQAVVILQSTFGRKF
ncbi:MAG: hypothetical protein BMS9Abin36_1374 [Gammaproteobacteria bacterium]|nr:MAG: hypothetical protein BMS9Abin36_1374 [Gammaproteobacteria bacterium]